MTLRVVSENGEIGVVRDVDREERFSMAVQEQQKYSNQDCTVDGLPHISKVAPTKDRPRCPQCGKRLQPQTWSCTLEDGKINAGLYNPDSMIAWTRVTLGFAETVNVNVWFGKWEGYFPFCTKNCALAYARQAYREKIGEDG